MTMREIQEHLHEISGTEVSHELISSVTDKVVGEVTAWQNRTLDEIYPIIYLGCIRVKTRDNSMVANKAVYLAIGINMEAINAVFPQTTVQLCIVHMARNSMKFVPWKDRKAVVADLKAIYSAPNEEAALQQLEAFRKKWDDKYSTIIDIWQRDWTGIAPCLAYPEFIKKAIYTTNAIEAINRQIRKTIKNKRVFPNDEAVKKPIFLALKNSQKKWTMPIKNWPQALNQFAILFADRVKF